MSRSHPATPRADVYSRITTEIVSAIEAGAGDWRMPWHHDGAATTRPQNVTSRRRYRGVNVLALWIAAEASSYSSGLWGTYRQWAALGGQVRKGERGTTVVFWKQAASRADDDHDDGEAGPGRMFARAFTVFNLAQVEGYASGRNLRTAVNDAVQTGLKASGELGPETMRLQTLSRVNVTREELRYASTYAPGMVVEVARRQRSQGLAAGEYRVVGTDVARERVTLENECGRQFEFRPGQMRPQGEQDPLRLFEVRALDIYTGDRIRWTETDHQRGLLNADQAQIVAVEKEAVVVKTSLGAEHRLEQGDPMLRRLDLAYALNAHMAQGLTSDRGIAVMDSRERNLANQQTFLVTITRLRDGLTLYVDKAGKLEAAVERNAGMKRSALETVDLLRDAASKGQAKHRVDPAPERKPPELDRSITKPFEIGI